MMNTRDKLGKVKEALSDFSISYQDIADATGYKMKYIRYMMHKNAVTPSKKFVDKVSEYVYGRIEQIKSKY